MTTVFIDGSAGTTGLRIKERLQSRSDITIITLSDELRKDEKARKEALNSCDIAFLCLPDAASIEAVALIENPNVTVIDASTAHRCNGNWAYGFPELSSEFFEKIQKSKRIAVPGCHASGFVSLVYPLVKAGIINPKTPLFCNSQTGYSGGGKKMIAEYEAVDRSDIYKASRQYALSLTHKHLPEMQKICLLEQPPLFCPTVGDFYSGMAVSVCFYGEIGSVAKANEVYSSLYTNGLVRYKQGIDEGGFLCAGALSGLDIMEVCSYGSENRVLLASRFDNLGKGASGAAIECMNIKMGISPETGLETGIL